jgi:hypothetical protein
MPPSTSPSPPEKELPIEAIIGISAAASFLLTLCCVLTFFASRCRSSRERAVPKEPTIGSNCDAPPPLNIKAGCCMPRSLSPDPLHPPKPCAFSDCVADDGTASNAPSSHRDKQVALVHTDACGLVPGTVTVGGLDQQVQMLTSDGLSTATSLQSSTAFPLFSSSGTGSPLEALEDALDAMFCMRVLFMDQYELLSSIERRSGGQAIVQVLPRDHIKTTNVLFCAFMQQSPYDISALVLPCHSGASSTCCACVAHAPCRH